MEEERKTTKKDTQDKFKELLIAEMNRRGLSMRGLEIKSGVKSGQICRYLNGTSPSLENAHRLLKALGICMVLGAEWKGENHE